MPFIDRQIIGPAIDLARRSEDYDRFWAYRAAGFEQGELRQAIDLEIGHRVVHRIEMAGLAGEVEKIVAAPEQLAHPGRVADIGDLYPHPVGDLGDVETVAAVIRQQAVDQDHPAAQCRELGGQIGADKAEPAGHNDLRPIEFR